MQNCRENDKNFFELEKFRLLATGVEPTFGQFFFFHKQTNFLPHLFGKRIVEIINDESQIESKHIYEIWIDISIESKVCMVRLWK